MIRLKPRMLRRWSWSIESAWMTPPVSEHHPDDSPGEQLETPLRTSESQRRSLSLVGCDFCGQICQRIDLSSPGETATCSRCDGTLYRYSSLAPSHWLALLITALVIFALANVSNLATLRVQGIYNTSSFSQALVLSASDGSWGVFLMVGLTAFFLPLTQMLLWLWALTFLSFKRMPPGFAWITRVLARVRPWSMVPVFFLACIVSMVKLEAMVDLQLDAGLWCFGALTAFMTLLGRLSPARLWTMAEHQGVDTLELTPEQEPNVQSRRNACCEVCGLVQRLPGGEGHCARCHVRLHVRKPGHTAWVWPLLFTAVALYFPANMLPIMNISSAVGDGGGHTILGGVVELWEDGSWDIALIVFIASVVVPLTKLFIITFLAWTRAERDENQLRHRTRLYQFVEFIGQWSMLDVFVVVLLSSLANFQALLRISVGPAAVSFGLVVVFSMFAAMNLDPRVAWDEAQDGAAMPPEPSKTRTNLTKESVNVG